MRRVGIHVRRRSTLEERGFTFVGALHAKSGDTLAGVVYSKKEDSHSYAHCTRRKGIRIHRRNVGVGILTCNRETCEERGFGLAGAANTNREASDSQAQ